MSDVFISYARSTVREAQAVAEALRRAGYSVWRDDDLPAHRAYAEVIQERILAAKAVVVIWSAEAARSEWVQSEADRARADHKLVQLRIDDTQLPMPFDRIQCANLAGWTGDPGAHDWRKVVQSVAELVGREPDQAGPIAPAAPAPAPPMPTKTGLRPWPWAALAAVILIGLVIAGGAWLGREFWRPTTARTLRVSVGGFQVIGRDETLARLAAELPSAIEGGLPGSGVEIIPTSPGAGPGAVRDADLVIGGVLDGDQDRIRVSAQVTDARRRAKIWSEAFEAQPKDVSTLRDRVMASTANVIRCVERAERPRGRSIPADALNLYLKACALKWDAGSFATVATLNRQAVARAPDFPAAEASLAMYETLSGGGQPSDVAAMARRALRLDPTQGAAYMALQGLVRPRSDWVRRDALFAAGLKADPTNDDLTFGQGRALVARGRVDEGLDFEARAVDLDPISPFFAAEYANTLASADRYEEARALIDKTLRLWPENDEAKSVQFWITAWNRPQEALGMLKDPTVAGESSPEGVQAWRDALIARQTRLAPDVAKATKEILDAEAKSGSTAIELLASIGQVDDAFTLANRIAADPDELETVVLFRTPTAPMLRDHRFMALAARVGLAQYWRKTGRWPDFCSGSQAPYDCKVEAARVLGPAR